MRSSSKLDKLQMPKGRSRKMSMEDLHAEEAQESPEDEAAESPEQQSMEEELGLEEHPEEAKSNMALEGATDDELLAEIKKRGLMSQLSADEGEGESEQSGEHDYSMS